MGETTIYAVPAMHCEHCVRAVTEEVSAVERVLHVSVDLEQKRVLVKGERVDDEAVRAAIGEAGYEATRA